VLISSTEASKNLHHVVNFLLLLCSSFIESSLLFKIEKLSTYNEFFSSYPLCEFLIVDIDEPIFHFFLFLAIVIIKLHLSKEKLSIIIVFDLEISSLWHIPDDLSRV